MKKIKNGEFEKIIDIQFQAIKDSIIINALEIQKYVIIHFYEL